MDIGAQAHQYEQQLAAKEQEVAQLKAELTAAYESLGWDDRRSRDAESQVTDLKRELEEAQDGRDLDRESYIAQLESRFNWVERAAAAEARVKELEVARTFYEELAKSCGWSGPRDTLDPFNYIAGHIGDLEASIAALISAAEPFMALTHRDTTEYHALAAAVEKAREGQA